MTELRARSAGPGADTDLAADHTGRVVLRVEDGVATVELGRPEKRNAMSRAMWATLLSHVETVDARDDVRVLVLRGRGAAFCAGADLAEVRKPDGTPSALYRELTDRTLRALSETRTPTVAAVHGACVGGGCAIALACDIRLAGEGAFFDIPAVRHGIVYDATAVTRMVEVMGSGRVAYLLYTGERLDARAAERLGLVDVVGPDLDGLVESVVRGTRHAAPRVVSGTLALIRHAADHSRRADGDRLR